MLVDESIKKVKSYIVNLINKIKEQEEKKLIAIQISGLNLRWLYLKISFKISNRTITNYVYYIIDFIMISVIIKINI